MSTIVRENHSLLRKANLKAAPDKILFFWRKVRFLGHVLFNDGLSPIASRADDIRNLKTPESRTSFKSFRNDEFLSHLYFNLSQRCKTSIWFN